jgi:hypothetical protein
MIYKNGSDLAQGLVEFIKESASLYIFVPYIKLETLKFLIDEQDNVKAIFVRWETKDLIMGSSDLEIYPYLKSKGISLYRNPRIHLKAYLDGFKRCFITSANISSRALNMPAFENYNYEIGTIVEKIRIEDRLYFNIIENESLLITDSIYKQLKNQLIEKKQEFPNEDDFTIDFNTLDKDFLISSLPMTYSIPDLLYGYYNKENLGNEELNCVLHDLTLYKIPFALEEEKLIFVLKERFFNHPFIKEFLGYVAQNGGEIYFGRAKEWIHQNCENVPLPRKWEITSIIQILFRWIEYSGGGKYLVDKPIHSERLSIIIN